LTKITDNIAFQWISQRHPLECNYWLYRLQNFFRIKVRTKKNANSRHKSWKKL